MAPGPKPIALVLSETERETLLGFLRRGRTSQDVALRARIVLACADPQATNTAIARRLGVSRQSVVTWRARFNARYPAWQNWLRRYQPPLLVIWGRYDPSFQTE